ncbi:MAG: hypothetical protein ACPG6V_05235 [Flavobacteriales bacterium]
MSKITKELKEQFIKEHGKNNLRIIEIPTNDAETEFMECLVLVPTRTIQSQYMKYIEVNFKKACDVLIKGCMLTGKEAVLADDALATSAVTGIAELIEIRQARVKKL